MPLLVRQDPVPLDRHKEHLRENGWSYRTAALQLGIGHQWLSDVLNGWQKSPTLAERVMRLGKCPERLMSARARNRMMGGEA